MSSPYWKERIEREHKEKMEEETANAESASPCVQDAKKIGGEE